MRLDSRLLLLAVLLAGASSAHATVIEYDATHISANQWRYDYSVTNDTLATPIDEITLWFDLGPFASLVSPVSPADWDGLVAQPDPALPDDGFYDALALNGGIDPGETLSGFSVLFDWSGAGTPSSQFFEIVDAVTFAVIDSGFTRARAAPPTAIPEPAAPLLMIWALAALALCRRRLALSSSL